MSRLLRGMALTSLLLASASVRAGEIQMDWTFNGTNHCANPDNYGDVCSYLSSVPGQSGAKLLGWANTGGASNTQLETTQLVQWGATGLGSYNRDWANGDTNEQYEPEHGIDNNGRQELVQLNFDTAIKLTGVEIGWSQIDSDLSVLAYLGDDAPVIAGKTFEQLLSSGWSVVGNYANAVVGSTLAVNAAGTRAKHWLVGAYNPLFGTGTGLTGGNDYIKLLSASGSFVQDIPEPTSLGLLLLGVAALRRRR